MRGTGWIGVFVVLVVGIALRLPGIDAPPLDSHHVRQADTSSMARLMLRDGIELLEPRIDWAGGDADLVESELPLYQAAVSVAWAGVGEPVGVTRGPAAAAARGISVFCWLVAALALGAWVRRRVDGPVWPCLLLFSLSPLAIVFTRNIQPDTLALALLLVGLERLDAACDRELGVGLAALAGIVLGLAVAVKGTMAFFLAAAIPLLAGSDPGARVVKVGVGLGLAVMTAGAWYLHAAGLDAPGTFGLWGASAHKWGGPTIWRELDAWSRIGGTLLAATWTPLGAVAVAVGLVGTRRRPRSAPFAFGVAGGVVAIVAVTEGFALHNYYQLPLVAFGSVLAGCALRDGWSTLRRARTAGARRALVVGLGVVALGASAIPARGFVAENLRLDRRPAAVAVAAGFSLPEDRRLVVADRHPQTVLFALDRRGFARTEVDRDEVRDLREEGASFLLVTDTSRSFAQDFGRTQVAAGAGWVVYSLDGEITSPAGSPAGPKTRAPGP